MAIELPFSGTPALVGMVHLLALPGSPQFAGDLGAVVGQAAEEAAVLAAAGFDAIMLENFGDVPFYKDALPPVTIAAMTRCALAVQAAAPKIPLGINALRNDAEAAMGIAVAVGARFIRVNVLVGAMVTDQGLIEGRAAQLLRLRHALGASVAILADVAVKHAAPLHTLDIESLARDTALRGGADALIVSGSGTGAPTDPARVAQVKAAVPGVPVLVGSGATPATISALNADGYIVGTALKRGGRVDPALCAALLAAAR